MGTSHYQYDSVNRLTKATYPTYTEELYYDKRGNRTKRLAKGIEELYSYDSRNRLTTLTRNQNADTQTIAYAYDKQGNLLKDDKATYTYDAFNRTQQVKTFDGHIQINHYDAEGLRHQIEEDGQLVQFIFSGKEVVVEQTETDTIRLIRGYDITASESEKARTYYHYVSDEQGSTTHIFEGQEVKNYYEYDAFGNLTTCEEKVHNRFKYTGQQQDPITQQYYLRARYYNPVIARFTQEDIYRGDGLNLYAYCSNNPIIYYDPSGFAGQAICSNTYEDLKLKYEEHLRDPNKPGLTKEEYRAYDRHRRLEENHKNPTDFARQRYQDKIDEYYIAQGCSKDSNNRWHDANGQYVSNLNKVKVQTSTTHKNSKSSTAPNHVYVIVDTRTGDMVKVGISGQPLLNNGGSSRANSQISPNNKKNKMNQMGLLDSNNPDRYKAIVVEENISRQQALDIEQQITDKHAARNQGSQPSKVHEKPLPRVDNTKDYEDLYGIAHNQSLSSNGRY